jgi:hypothetical protein
MRTRPFILVCFAVTGMLLLAQCHDRNGTDDDTPKNYWQYDDSTHSIHGDVNDDGTIIHDRKADTTTDR